MKKYSIWCLIAVSVFIMNNCNSNDRSSLTINSPDKRISVGFFLNKEDQGGYKIDFNALDLQSLIALQCVLRDLESEKAEAIRCARLAPWR